MCLVHRCMSLLGRCDSKQNKSGMFVPCRNSISPHFILVVVKLPLHVATNLNRRAQVPYKLFN